MNYGASIIVCISTLAPFVSVSSSPPVLSITIRSSKTVYAVGEPVPLNIVFSNPTTTPIQIWRSPGSSQGELYSDVDVTYLGKRLFPTPYERGIEAGQVGPTSRIGSSIVAGKTAKDGMTLNRLFDLNKIGRYTVQIRHRDHGDPTAVGTSNTATFEIK